MTARIHIDGRAVTVPAGRDLLSTCLDAGVAVPHFCWHRAMGSVGACRLCAVKVYNSPDDPGHIEMACMTAVADGQRIEVADPEAAFFRARVIEWLMVNHPHDCAVCEEGGACQLQDMTIASGHHRRRAGPEKRTHRNQYLGPLLTHEMNRCIACYRCTRFYRDYAGGRDLDVFGAHDRVYFGRAEDGVLESPFAGNLDEVCPTGVFNDKGWSNVYARPWDMAETPSVCTHCSVGCNVTLSARAGRLRRAINRRHDAINGDFLCDRGRYGATFAQSPRRLVDARAAGQPVAVAAALDRVAALLAQGPAIGIGSPRASLEANYALRRLVGPDRFFAGVSDSETALVDRIAAQLAGAAQIASLADIETADAALVLGEDLTGTAPRAALSLRQMARGAERDLAAQKGVPAFLDSAVRVAGEGRRSPITLVTPLPDALDSIAALPLRRTPDAIAAFGHAVAAAIGGAPAADADVAATAAALAGAAAPLVIAGAGLGDIAIIDAAAAVAAALGARARLALFPPETNSLGLSLLGALPLCDRPANAGTVIVLENDLFARCDPAQVDALFAGRTVIALDCIDTATTGRADIVLPVASIADAAGTFINHEGRAQRAFAAIADGPPAAWRMLAALGAVSRDTNQIRSSRASLDFARDEREGGAALQTRRAAEPDLDSLLAALVHDCPHLAAVLDAAPGAGFTTAVGRIARAPARFSGRTASDRAGRIGDATPPTDPDSPFSWTMEGAAFESLPQMLFAGAPVIVAGSHPAPVAVAPPPPSGSGLRLIPLHDPFRGGETDQASSILAARAPAPRLLLHPADAAALGLSAGDPVSADGAPAPALTLDPAMPRGHVGLTTRHTSPRRIRLEGRP
ncbi:NADH-quinone oxidoreductase subunit G [Polymorphobacter fuscus]|uniref:NADH-quinone oxidoreductase subunit NuoG n=1 Tax=Sandarakinorhabdus fusca TaxID=1439888 RepID=UPI0014319EBB|nr:NADH-quinone oxidoreductase subunit NuoG [Polymorphobacter fuscus]NJC08098.1 NADH-quinone oxidoreductase subunit G [Polymorphobacter fuscus]